MTLSINTNLASLNAQRNQSTSQSELATAIARLSSGLRINSAADDAAGLAIADRFTAQINGTTQAGRNANDGISLAQTADGALASIDDNLQRMRELAVQSANATNSASDRASLQLEVTQLQSEIDRVASQTQFNGVNLLDGSYTGQAFQVGSNAGQTISVGNIQSMRASALGVFDGFEYDAITIDPDNTPQPLTVTGAALGGTVQLANVASDAKAIAAALNTSFPLPGLTATAHETDVAAATSAAAGTVSGTAAFTINGVSISIAGTAGAAGLAGNRQSAVTAINAQSAATGVVATDTGSGVSLSAADGRNVALSYSAGSFTNSLAADFGLSSTPLTGGTFDLRYQTSEAKTGLRTLVFQQTSLFIPAHYGRATNGTPLNFYSFQTPVGSVDVSSAAGANTALATIDTALATVASARAQLGASQNRLASAIGNLQNSGDNLTASRSRIEDADFGQETANLSRGQVLQQAATAMVAQANQSPRQVLALLK